jgi:hypothetical protein
MLNRLVGDDWSHNVKHNVILRIQVRGSHGDPVQVNAEKNRIRIIRGADLLFWRWFHRQGLRHFVSVFCLVAKWLFWACRDTGRAARQTVFPATRDNLYIHPQSEQDQPVAGAHLSNLLSSSKLSTIR